MEDKNQASSDVSPVTGMANADPSDFLAEEEQAIDDASDAQEVAETQVAEETPATEQVAEEAPQLYAGKFKDTEALRDAFTQLGGNPDDYGDPKLLEEAYKVREREFSRSRQQIADLERNTEAETETPQVDRLAEIEKQIDWNKVENAQDLFRETLKVVDQMYQERSAQDQTALVEKVMNALTTREQTTKEIADLEADVPRLKSDSNFRGAFAHYVAGQRQMGQFQNLKGSMKSFLAIGQSISEDAVQEKQAAEKAKASAQSAEAPAAEPTTSKPKDELDDIVAAFQDRKNLFG